MKYLTLKILYILSFILFSGVAAGLIMEMWDYRHGWEIAGTCFVIAATLSFYDHCLREEVKNDTNERK